VALSASKHILDRVTSGEWRSLEATLHCRDSLSPPVYSCAILLEAKNEAVVDTAEPITMDSSLRNGQRKPGYNSVITEGLEPPKHRIMHRL
jgi:hypothetical protein